MTGQQNKLGRTDASGILSVSYSKNVTIVCLIGDGQKPLSGEAGIEAWIDALKLDTSWKVYAPKNMQYEFSGVTADFFECLHLNVAKRQHFINLAPWVEAILAGDLEKAKKEFAIINSDRNQEKIGIKITISLERLYRKDRNGKCVLEKLRNTRGDGYLFGILCSSKNQLNVMSGITGGIIWQRWDPTRKRYDTNTYMEKKFAYLWYGGQCCDTENVKVATETFCQGLEVDLPIVFMGGDFLLNRVEDGYERIFNPSQYDRERYGTEIETIMEDTYRILLTRATEEMLIVIPKTEDHRFDDTYNFFKEIGVSEYP